MNKDTNLIFEAYRKKLNEEASMDLSVDTIKHAIEATLEPFRSSGISFTSEGKVSKYLGDKKIAPWEDHEKYRKAADLFDELAQKSSMADKNFSHDQHPDDEEETPEYKAAVAKHREELKARGWEPMEHGGSIKNQGGDTLFYFWSGESY